MLTAPLFAGLQYLTNDWLNRRKLSNPPLDCDGGSIVSCLDIAFTIWDWNTDWYLRTSNVSSDWTRQPAFLLNGLFGFLPGNIAEFPVGRI